MSEFRVIFSTCPDADTAGSIARAVVEEKLAACVNIVSNVRSIYRWQGNVCDDGEHLLIIKTTRERVDSLRAKLVELHPYECPEFIAMPIESGHPPYLDWITEQT